MFHFCFRIRGAWAYMAPLALIVALQGVYPPRRQPKWRSRARADPLFTDPPNTFGPLLRAGGRVPVVAGPAGARIG
jgi:hypothetical protein